MPRPHEPPMPDPLAYFLTWPTYGTWLPGDERGWVEHRRGWHLPDPVRKLEAQARMTEDACVLDAEQRLLVERTIVEHCRIRGWELHAVNCRSNHLHVVVTAGLPPTGARAIQSMVYAPAEGVRGKRLGCECPDERVRENWWVERGSDRCINDAECLEAATLYVRDAQDDPARYQPEARARNDGGPR